MYCDNAATTELTNEVKEYIISILDLYGNPSSTHSLGNKVKQIINTARINVAKFINANDDNIIFTSSGSSANSLAILGTTNELSRYCLYCSPTSHKSMLLTCRNCKCNHMLEANEYGEIDIIKLENELIRLYSTTPIVCIDVANSEIGVIRNIKNICNVVHKYNGIVIADFTGYIPSFKVDVKDIDVDIATFSGHKLHALKGIGVLYKKENIKLKPLVYGSQEYGLFGGTENVIGIASLSKAVETYNYSSISYDGRDYLYNKLVSNISNCHLIGKLENRLPHNLYMCFEGVNGSDLMNLLDINGIQVSTGSACNSGDKVPSSTLMAIGIDNEYIHSCIRISLSGNESMDDLDFLYSKIKDGVEFLRNK